DLSPSFGGDVEVLIVSHCNDEEAPLVGKRGQRMHGNFDQDDQATEREDNKVNRGLRSGLGFQFRAWDSVGDGHLATKPELVLLTAASLVSSESQQVELSPGF